MPTDDATLPIHLNGCYDADVEPGTELAITALPAAVEVTPANLFAALLADAEKPATRRARDQGVRDFASFLGRAERLTHCPPEAACAWLVSLKRGSANAAVDGYRRDLRERNLAPSTINQRICTLSRVVWLANKYELIEWSLLQEAMPVETLRDTEGPGQSGWKRFHAQAKEEAKQSGRGVRNLAIVRLLYFCALRREEVATLDLADWNPDSGRLMVLRKHQRQKTYAANPNTEATSSVEAWLAVRGREPGPLFYRMDNAATGRTAEVMGLGLNRMTGDAIYYTVTAIGLRCKPPVKVTPHGLRHCAITEAARRGANTRDLQEFAAHKHSNTTDIYVKRQDDGASKVGRLLSDSEA